MERIWVVVDQIEFAKNLLSSGKFSYLRIALLLLDNVLEILMYRRIMDDFDHDEFYEKLNNNAKSSLPKDIYESWRREANFQLIGIKQKKLITKFFDEKLTFLSEDKDSIKQPVANALRSIHRYRNEAYHRDHIRKETIRPIVMLLFEIVCDLLVDLPPSSYVFHSGENWSEYFTRYEVPGKNLLPDDGLKLISDKLKSGVILDLQNLKLALKTHIKTRLEDALSNIDFIMKDGFGITSRAEAFKKILFMNDFKGLTKVDYDSEYTRYIPQYDISCFENWAHRAERFEDCIDKYGLFNAFSSLEEEFEKVEKIIIEAARELDSYIQMQIDIMRGK